MWFLQATLVKYDAAAKQVVMLQKFRTKVCAAPTNAPVFEEEFEFATPGDGAPLLLVLELMRLNRDKAAKPAMAAAPAEPGASVTTYGKSKLSLVPLCAQLLEGLELGVRQDFTSMAEGEPVLPGVTAEAFVSFFDEAGEGEYSDAGEAAELGEADAEPQQQQPAQQPPPHQQQQQAQQTQQHAKPPPAKASAAAATPPPQRKAVPKTPTPQAPPPPASFAVAADDADGECGDECYSESAPASARGAAAASAPVVAAQAKTRPLTSSRRSGRPAEAGARPASATGSARQQYVRHTQADKARLRKGRYPLAPIPLAAYELGTATDARLSDTSVYAREREIIFSVVVLEATALPLVGTELPEAFVAVRTSAEDREGKPALTATRVAKASRRPAWGEALELVVPATGHGRDDGLVFTITDASSQTLLARFAVPLRLLDLRACYAWQLQAAGPGAPTLSVALCARPAASEVARGVREAPASGMLYIALGRLARPSDSAAHVQAVVRFEASAASFWQRLASTLGTGADPQVEFEPVPATNLSAAARRSPVAMTGFSSAGWAALLPLAAEAADVLHSQGAALVVEFYRARELHRGIYDPDYLGLALVPLRRDLQNKLASGVACALGNIPVLCVSTADDDIAAAAQLSFSAELLFVHAGEAERAASGGGGGLLEASAAAAKVSVPSLPLSVRPSQLVEAAPADAYSDYSYYSYSDDASSRAPSRRRAARGVARRGAGKEKKQRPAQTQAQRRGGKRAAAREASASSLDRSGGAGDGGCGDDDEVSLPTASARSGGRGPGGTTYVELAPEAAALTGDIKNKQALIDRLLGEVDEKSAALKAVGSDMQALHKANTALRARVAELTAQMEERASDGQRLSDVAQVDALDRDELTRRHVALAQRYRADTRRYQETQLRVERLQNELIRHNEREKAYLELEAAHTAQAAFVQRLQDDNASVAKYKAAIKAQEEVIARMEAVIAQRGTAPLQSPVPAPAPVTSPTTKGGSGSGASAALTQENNRLRQQLAQMQAHVNQLMLSSGGGAGGGGAGGAGGGGGAQIVRLQMEIDELTRKTRRLEEDLARALSLAGQGDLDSDRLMLLMRAEVAESRAKSLETQLVEQTKDSGRQIAALKSQLATGAGAGGGGAGFAGAGGFDGGFDFGGGGHLASGW